MISGEEIEDGSHGDGCAITIKLSGYRRIRPLYRVEFSTEICVPDTINDVGLNIIGSEARTL
jgi:hypothetical protein